MWRHNFPPFCAHSAHLFSQRAFCSSWARLSGPWLLIQTWTVSQQFCITPNFEKGKCYRARSRARAGAQLWPALTSGLGLFDWSALTSILGLFDWFYTHIYSCWACGLLTEPAAHASPGVHVPRSLNPLHSLLY